MGIRKVKGAATSLRREGPYIAMALPAFAFFGLFVLIPLIRGIPISLTKWDGFSANSEFVGLANYVRLISDRFFFNSIGVTIRFTLYEVIGCNVLGLAFAVLLKRTTRLNNVGRTLVFMPHVISLLLSAYMIRYLLNEVYSLSGVVNILGDKDTAVAGISIIAIWRDTGYCMIIYVAALQGVDQSLYEVARIEGASPVKQFFQITLPMIMPSITANVTLLTAWGLKLYDYPMAATSGGGPGRATESVSIYIYNNIFPLYKAGYGQAVAIVWIFVIFLITQTLQSALRKLEVDL